MRLNLMTPLSHKACMHLIKSKRLMKFAFSLTVSITFFVQPIQSNGQCVAPRVPGPNIKSKGSVELAFLSDIRRRIKRTITAEFVKDLGFFPNPSLSFTILENGQIANLKFDRSSEIESVDKQAIQIIERILPLRKPPSGLTNSTISATFSTQSPYVKVEHAAFDKETVLQPESVNGNSKIQQELNLMWKKSCTSDDTINYFLSKCIEKDEDKRKARVLIHKLVSNLDIHRVTNRLRDSGNIPLSLNPHYSPRHSFLLPFPGLGKLMKATDVEKILFSNLLRRKRKKFLEEHLLKEITSNN